MGAEESNQYSQISERLINNLKYRLSFIYGRDFNTNEIIREIKKVKHLPIPITHDNSTANDIKRFRDAVLSQYILRKHPTYVREIGKKTGINIELLLPEYRIANSVKNKDNAFGNVYFMFPTQDFDGTFRETNFARRYTLKIQDSKKDPIHNSALEYEAYMQKLFSKNNLTYDVIKEFHFDNGKNNKLSFIVTDKYPMTLSHFFKTHSLTKEYLDLIFKSIISLLEKFCKHGLVHGDFHWNNIGVEYIDKPFPLDFGFSTQYKKCILKIELLQLLRTLRYIEFKDPSNRDFLEDKIYNYYINRYKERLDKTPEGLYGYETMYDAYMDKYLSEVFDPNKKKFLENFKNYII